MEGLEAKERARAYLEQEWRALKRYDEKADNAPDRGAAEAWYFLADRARGCILGAAEALRAAGIMDYEECDAIGAAIYPGGRLIERPSR